MSSTTAPAAPTATTTMRAVVQDGYGGADVLHLAERPVPHTVRDDEVVSGCTPPGSTAARGTS